MNIQQFYYVLAVAEYRHFETAADKCFISQSTLSTMISRLEDELGIIIFNRKKKPVELTREGAKLVDQLKIITSEIAHLEEMAMEMRGEMKGKVNISCIPTVAPYLLPKFLYDFAAAYPELELEIREHTTDEIIRLLELREVDIGIVSTPIGHAEMVEYPLYKEDFVYFDSSSNGSPIISISEVNLENFWLLEEGHCMSDQIMDICNTSGHEINAALNISFKAGSIGSLLHFARSYSGRTLLPQLAVLEMSDEEKRFLRYFETPAPNREIGIIVHQHFVKRKVLELLIKIIKAKVKLIEKGIAVL
ncbi:MAG: LysR family transcriptional regulator [Saprospiraceae bacterium]|nr:MAG: LysR family transcriptional regulator [Bacteroidetes bacterium OLB9]MCO6464255.1 LysR family transcriptional regulator [Saprospiraceae bacterium]MCZ2338901.1 LysR family transcriptional regulator [Chitinophagales bacterium]